jgi:hypothetical protein
MPRSFETDASLCVQFFYVGETIPNADAKKLETAAPGKPAIHLYSP